VSPVPTTNRTPLRAICVITSAWRLSTPASVVPTAPKSPRTANENGAVAPAGSCALNEIEGSEPSRSITGAVDPSSTR
jgi:hypothetical protein